MYKKHDLYSLDNHEIVVFLSVHSILSFERFLCPILFGFSFTYIRTHDWYLCTTIIHPHIYTHTDNDGPYYWHIKSGTIQREPPLWPKNESKAKELKTPVSFVSPTSPFLAQSTITTSSRNANNTNPLMQLFGSKGDIADLRGSSSNRLQVNNKKKKMTKFLSI